MRFKALRSNNPADLLIVVALIIVGGVGAAWFVLRDDAALVPTATASVSIDVPVSAVAADRFKAPEAEQTGNVLVELELARLALDAGQYLEPVENNALIHYLNALALEPDSQEARDGVDGVLRLVLEQAELAASEGRFADARVVVARVREVQPGHPGLAPIESRLAGTRRTMLEEVEQLVADGAFDAAETRLEGLQTIGAATDSVTVLRRRIADGRRAAERKARAEAQQQAALNEAEQEAAQQAQLIDDLLEQAHQSLDAGRLLEPAGQNAAYFIAEVEALDAGHAALDILRDALVAALVEQAGNRIAAGQLDAAAGLLDEAERLGGAAATAQTRTALIQTLAAAEGQRIIPASELEIVRYVPPEYPSLAIRRQVEGWVEVVFVVDEAGKVGDVQIANGERDAYFKSAAIDAVSQWQFRPRVVHGQPIAQRVNARLSFKFE